MLNDMTVGITSKGEDYFRSFCIVFEVTTNKFQYNSIFLIQVYYHACKFSIIVKQGFGNISGSGGNGKTTATKHFAISWAKSSADELQDIDFVFYIALKAVKSNDDIEKIVIAQHKGLKGNNVQPDEIRRLLHNFTKQRIAILLDGYDEYRPGTNDDIDKVITKDYLWNCTVLVTSRDTKGLRELRNSMDTEIEIIGFDKEGVEDYATKFLGGPEESDELLANAEACDINNRLVNYGILHIPIFLHMICSLFKSGILIMKGKVAVISAIVERCLNYESIRKTEKKRMNDGAKVITNLGQLALKGLQKEQFVFKEVSLKDVVI